MRVLDWLNSPAYGARSSVPGQQGRVITYASMARVIDNLHGDELGAKGKDIEVYLDTSV